MEGFIIISQESKVLEMLVKKLKNMGVDENSRIVITRAPGRANIIGEHTDYNNGFVMPAAINRYVYAAGAVTNENTATFFSFNMKQKKSLDLKRKIEFSKKDGWLNYIKGVFYEFRKLGYPIEGVTGVIYGTIPLGGGLSSSAALEISVALMLSKLYGIRINNIELANLGFRAENDFVKVSCGIMDQFASVLAKEETALFIDTNNQAFEYVPFPSSRIKLVLIDTKVKHNAPRVLNQRKKECQDAIRMIRRHGLNITTLRDLSLNDFKKIKELIPELYRKRVEHVIYENERVLYAKDALANGNLELLGQLMYDSHGSCRELYEVSCAELDFIVDLAVGLSGVIGARMTGAGLGGNVLILAWEEAVQNIIEIISEEYHKAFRIVPGTIISPPVDGVKIIYEGALSSFTNKN